MKALPNLDKLIDQSLTGGLEDLSEECQATFRLGAQLILVLVRNDINGTLTLNRFQQTEAIVRLRDELDNLLTEKT